MNNEQSEIVARAFGIIHSILHYYSRVVGVGHTFTMLNGATSSPRAVVVCRTRRIFDYLAKPFGPKRGVILDDFTGSLTMEHAPLAWDNTAIVDLLELVKDAMHYLTEENAIQGAKLKFLRAAFIQMGRTIMEQKESLKCMNAELEDARWQIEELAR